MPAVQPARFSGLTPFQSADHRAGSRKSDAAKSRWSATARSRMLVTPPPSMRTLSHGPQAESAVPKDVEPGAGKPAPTKRRRELPSRTGPTVPCSMRGAGGRGSGPRCLFRGDGEGTPRGRARGAARGAAAKPPPIPNRGAGPTAAHPPLAAAAATRGGCRGAAPAAWDRARAAATTAGDEAQALRLPRQAAADESAVSRLPAAPGGRPRVSGGANGGARHGGGSSVRGRGGEPPGRHPMQAPWRRGACACETRGAGQTGGGGVGGKTARDEPPSEHRGVLQRRRGGLPLPQNT